VKKGDGLRQKAFAGALPQATVFDVFGVLRLLTTDN